MHKRKPKNDKDHKPETVEKKGVGYTTGVGEVWDVEAYM